MNLSVTFIFGLLVLHDCIAWVSHPKRRDLFQQTIAVATTSLILSGTPAVAVTSTKKCTDIESCREIGDRKVEQDMKENPVVTLGSGLRYKVVKPGFGSRTVTDSTSSVDLIYSITQANGAYMYSRGFGFEKINVGGTMVPDVGLDSLRVAMGAKEVPVGIERALVGMRKGERRRVELPPELGFPTSQGRPAPTTRRAKASLVGYQRLVDGNGSTQPGFPAPTIWDVEVQIGRASCRERV